MSENFRANVLKKVFSQQIRPVEPLKLIHAPLFWGIQSAYEIKKIIAACFSERLFKEKNGEEHCFNISRVILECCDVLWNHLRRHHFPLLYHAKT